MEAHHLDFAQSSDVGDVKNIGRLGTSTGIAWHRVWVIIRPREVLGNW